MAAGRPTDYTLELAELICHRVASHGMGLKQICAMYDDMPNPSTIYDWRAKNEQFSEMYLNSRRKQAHILVETSLDDVEDIQKYYYEDPMTGVTRVDSGVVAAQKALAAQKTWLAGKFRVQDYGDKQQTESTVTLKHEESIKDLA